MPVEIVDHTPTPGNGEIHHSDLEKMKKDFIEQADLKPYNGRNRLIKKFSVSVMKDELKRLIDYYEDYEGHDRIKVIKMNFAIHIDPFQDCHDIINSDSLTVVVEAAEFIDPQDHTLGQKSHTDIGDFVVIPGYKSSTKNQWTSDDCCPSANP